jgi:hypothetical protein
MKIVEGSNNNLPNQLKNFLKEKSNNNTVGDSITRLIERESNATRRSRALLNKNISELLVLLKDKKAKDRERRF